MKRFAQLFVVLVVLPSVLAGCFRSAGDTIEPTQDVEPSAVALAVSTSEVGAAATVPPITILPPNTRPPTTAPTVEAEPTATRPPQTIVPPPTATPQFITPGSPLGPVPFTTSIPVTPADGTAEVESMAEAAESDVTRAASADDECVYIVQSGDSLYSIAIDHDTTIDDLLAANPDLEGDPPILYPDDEIQLPDCGDNVTRAAPTLTATTAAPRVTGTATSGEVYIVEPGDTVFNIARRYGLTVAEIVAANPGLDPDRISIGQRIIIPPSEE